MVLLGGPPGSGKTTFCQQSVLQALPLDKPVIYVTTEYGPSRVEESLKEAGLQQMLYGLPQNLSKPKDVKKLSNFLGRLFGEKGRHDFIVEYLEDVSERDEYQIRAYENAECWGFKNTTIASMFPPAIAGGIQGLDKEKRDWNRSIAGFCKGLEKEEREWNAIETKCVGLGDPYCEWGFR